MDDETYEMKDLDEELKIESILSVFKEEHDEETEMEDEKDEMDKEQLEEALDIFKSLKSILNEVSLLNIKLMFLYICQTFLKQYFGRHLYTCSLL